MCVRCGVKVYTLTIVNFKLERVSTYMTILIISYYMYEGKKETETCTILH